MKSLLLFLFLCSVDYVDRVAESQKVDIFGTCLSSIIYRTLKSCFKGEYKLTDERCEQYTPSESKQEKSKYGLFSGEDGGAR